MGLNMQKECGRILYKDIKNPGSLETTSQI
jgi:hypothetical protein